MKKTARSRVMVWFALGAVLWIAGCADAEPFVHIDDEFNRSRADFGREPTERDAVDICYSKRATSWDEIVAMASEICGLHGKAAVPRSRDFLTCPIETPTRARFWCRERV